MKHALLLKIGKDIARHVATKIRQAEDLGIFTGTTGKGGDATKRGDQLVEDELRAVVAAVIEKHQLPGCLIISEETGQWKIGNIESSDAIFMVIDPIDGSNNMRPRPTPKPFLGFSIGLGKIKDLLADGTFHAITAGVIQDIFHDEQYAAQKDGGAFLNGVQVRASAVNNLSEVILGTSLDRVGEKLQHILDKGLMKLLLATKCQRRIGSTALDLARVATGDYDAYVSLSGDVKVHDIAAAKLIIEEAGGVFGLYKYGKDISSEPWLMELYKRGDAGLKEISFEIVASGSKQLSKAIKAAIS